MSQATPSSIPTTIDANAVASRYLAAWNETDADARRRLLSSIWTEDATFVDPMASVNGTDAIDGMIAAVQQRFPAFRFAVYGTPQAHNDRIRFSWSLGNDDSPELVIGTDFGVLGPDGRMRAVTGFFDKIPG